MIRRVATTSFSSSYSSGRTAQLILSEFQEVLVHQRGRGGRSTKQVQSFRVRWDWRLSTVVGLNLSVSVSINCSHTRFDKWIASLTASALLVVLFVVVLETLSVTLSALSAEAVVAVVAVAGVVLVVDGLDGVVDGAVDVVMPTI